MRQFYSFLNLTLFSLSFLSIHNSINAQVGTGFEDRTTSADCTATSCQYFDSGNAAVAHVLADNATIPVSSTSSGSTLGFMSSYRPTRSGGTGLVDGDAFGYAKSAAAAAVGAAPIEGSQVFFAEDTDGEVTITFDAVDLSAAVSPMFSMNYIVDGSFESGNGANDRLYIRLEVTGCGSPTTLSLFDSDGGGSGGGSGGDMDNVTTDKVWVTINQDLSAYVGCQIKLVIEIDLDSSTEEIALDNISFSSGSILPVALTEFTAREKKEQVNLAWATALEINNRGFSVERSSDGRVFNSIGWIDGFGDSSEKIAYRFEDKNVIAGRSYYYRLRQEDFDGDFEYSPVVSIVLKSGDNNEIVGQLYPNPTVSGQVNLDLNLEYDANYKFSIISHEGRVLSTENRSLSSGFNQVNFNLEQYSKGIYFIRVEGKDSVVHRRLIR